MPTFNLPFFNGASSPPPGSSYYISNALIVAKRAALGLEDPIRIHPGVTWEVGNPLFDWRQRHAANQIQCVQLRKETKAPFYHEYVAMRLSNGRCFRIDRRQLPNEQLPLGCTEHEGVEAYDTIEEIADIEDSMYNQSNCLFQLDLRACGYRWDESHLWPVFDASKTEYSRADWETRYLHDFHQWSYENQDIIAQWRIRQPPPYRASGWKKPWWALRDIVMGSTTYGLSEVGLENLIRKLSEMIQTHGMRVEEHKFFLGQSAEDVHWGVKVAMNDVWEETLKSNMQLSGTTARKEMGAWLVSKYGTGTNRVKGGRSSPEFQLFI